MKFSRNLKQTAVYWALSGADGYGGYTFDDPVELSPDESNGVRWEKVQKLFINSLGEERLSQSRVYTAQDVTLGGYLYLGELDDIASSVTGPEDVSGAYKIQQFDKLPDLKAVNFLRMAWL